MIILLSFGSSFWRQIIGVKSFLLCITALLLSVSGFGQSTDWVGRWFFEYKQAPHIPTISMTLEIGEPTSKMLYPSRLTLKHNDFLGEYNLLLVEKNSNELAIARNKYPISESPYSLGPWMIYLNGVFENKENDTMTLRRMWFDNFGVFMKGVYENEVFTIDKVYLRDFLYQSSISLKRVDTKPWSQKLAAKEIIHSDSIYYGIYDTFLSKNGELDLDIRDEERYDRDTITIVHNGKIFIDRMPVERAMRHRKLKLDSGTNYIAFFADNYGSLPPNTANFILTDTDSAGYSYNFSHRSNAYSTLMVASFNYDPIKKKPEPVKVSKTVEKSLERSVEKNEDSTKPSREIRKIGAWKVTDPVVFLEIWDDQLQDGDKISILLNGVVVQKGIAVLREPQRLGIRLKKGLNQIRFVAENEGEIPPNTAVLRTLSGEKNRLFYLNTSLDTDNVLTIDLH